CPAADHATFHRGASGACGGVVRRRAPAARFPRRHSLTMPLSASTACQLIDELVNLDFVERAVDKLYEAARAAVGGSPVLAAARAIEGLPDGSTIVIATGSVS